MPHLLLETAAGYALFNMGRKGLIRAEPEDIQGKFTSAEKALKAVKLTHLERYNDVKEATAELFALKEGKMGDKLKSFLKKRIVKKGLGPDGLGVWDKALAKTIRREFKDVEILMSPSIHEIFRGVMTYADSLISDLRPEDMKKMAVSLSHSLNRFKLKFSPEKVDIMVIQAVGLLDDIDKELNNLGMRLREWYGFHFPELLKIINENLTFARFVKHVGYRTNVQNMGDLESVVGISSEIEAQVRQAAETSMGSELVDEDLLNIRDLAESVLDFGQRRQELTEYLRTRMMTIAPNLTHLVGEVLGAKLLAASGSLMGLAKQASSTVQILGAEKALFRALKTKSNTPKYGLIYHAHLVSQASPKLKGKTSRMLAAKLSLCARVDALSEGSTDLPSVAVGAKAYLEHRLTSMLDSAARDAASGSVPGQAQQVRYIPSRMRDQQLSYNAADDQIGVPVIKKVKEEQPSDPGIQPATKKIKTSETIEERAARKAARKAAKAAAAATAVQGKSPLLTDVKETRAEKEMKRKQHENEKKKKASSKESAVLQNDESSKKRKKHKKGELEKMEREHKKRRTE